MVDHGHPVYPKHGFKIIDGGLVNGGSRQLAITLTKKQWIDVLDHITTSRDTHEVFGRSYSTAVNNYHFGRALNAVKLFDEINKGLSQ